MSTMSTQQRQRRMSISSQQTIDEDLELDTSAVAHRLRNPSYKHSIKASTDTNLRDLRGIKMALRPAESDSDEGESQESQGAGKQDTESPLTTNFAEMPLKLQPNTLTTPRSPMLKKEDWQGKNQSHKLDSVFDSINKLYSVYEQVSQRIQPLEIAIFDKTDGILPQLQGLADYAKEADTRVDSLMKENISLKEELEVVKGILHKQSKQITALQGRQAHQTARSMADNIVFTGLLGDSSEADNTVAQALVTEFLEEKLEIEFEQHDILVTHWMGQYVKDKHRPIITRVRPNLRKNILDNTTKLANKLNEMGRPYSVNLQLPEMLAEQKREVRQIIKERKDAEKSLDETSKSKILVRNNNVYINGQLQRKLLKPPTITQLFETSDGEKKQMKKLKIKYTQPKPMKNSEFMGAACVVNNMNEVHLAYKKLFLKFPGVDHIVAGFSCEGKEGYQDDSEFSAGFRVLNVIRDTKFTNVAVFVIREYGGQHLGPARFTTIREVAEEALQLIF